MCRATCEGGLTRISDMVAHVSGVLPDKHTPKAPSCGDASLAVIPMLAVNRATPHDGANAGR